MTCAPNDLLIAMAMDIVFLRNVIVVLVASIAIGTICALIFARPNP